MNELRKKYAGCKPNDAHKIIAELEKDYNVVVITQNVDTLHELLTHLHGNLNQVRAIDDDNLYFEYLDDITPEIRGHKVRPHIVLFGEDVPNIGLASKELLDADICVVIGTSFNVYPAAGLVQYVECSHLLY